MKSIFSDAADFNFFSQIFNLPPEGNFDGKIILQYVSDRNEKADRAGLNDKGVSERIDASLRKLLEYRSSHRVRPATDDKTLVAWNALTMQALAEAGRVLDRVDYLAAAQRNADFLLSNLYAGDRLFRSWRAGTPKQNGTLEDYSALAISLLTLYQSDFDLRWYRASLKMAQAIFNNFLDPDGGFYLTQPNLDDLPIRPKDLQDNATPSGNAQAVFALCLLAAYGEDKDWQTTSENTLTQLQDIAVRYPTAFSYWLKAIDFAVGPVHQVAVVWPDGKDAGKILTALHKEFRPRMVVAVSSTPLLNGSPELLADRPPRGDTVTAYICHGFVCDLPMTGQEQILASLKDLH